MEEVRKSSLYCSAKWNEKESFRRRSGGLPPPAAEDGDAYLNGGCPGEQK
ncbi:hypothetical protein HMPREF7215_1875 [Pyramidobacter piscolens W5455]|uniref:Uncharacterized protein n=1 Tax=Pyramidobacter piscolens W5455 TaxID=352165 RepID=A0ABM9ZUF4_9BACT|nr:hypothetical protein HMPREF7215_1875 [Pyramidobacter piscolens W5455]